MKVFCCCLVVYSSARKRRYPDYIYYYEKLSILKIIKQKTTSRGILLKLKFDIEKNLNLEYVINNKHKYHFFFDDLRFLLYLDLDLLLFYYT